MKPTIAPRRLLLLLLILSSGFALQAQVRIRHFEPGWYYDKAGVKHSGFIDFGANFWGTVKINFKVDSLTADNQRIGISDIKSVVVMHKPDTAYPPGTINIAKQMVADSFVVVQENDDSPDSVVTEARLCKFVTDGVNAKIYSRNVKKSSGGFGVGVGSFGVVSMAVGMSAQYTDTLYLCEEEGKVLQLRRSNYKQLLSRAFADDPDLVQKIQTKQIKFGELNRIIGLYVAHRSL